MSKIRIKNFGVIHDSGWLDIKKVTVFLGNQGSGKSTVAKLISTFLWMEKVLFRGDYTIKQFERKGIFKSQRLKYHRIENYLISDSGRKTTIEFKGEIYDFNFSDGRLSISEKINKYNYYLPEIVYIPAERNFISYVKSSKELKLSSDSFNGFVDDYNEAKTSINGGVLLPINKSIIEYDRLNDRIKLKGPKHKSIMLFEAASGFQSVAPLFLVSHHFSNLIIDSKQSNEISNEKIARFKKQVEEIYNNKDLSEELRKAAMSALSKKFRKEAFVNIVEEPEQNLFPKSQADIFYALLGFNLPENNMLITTTHSPYIIGALSLAIKAAAVKEKIKSRTDLLKRLSDIVPDNAMVKAEDVAIYQLEENTGTATLLSMDYGVPSDKNYLNELLGGLDSDFDRLLDIEDDL
jgi:predicted ATPase